MSSSYIISLSVPRRLELKATRTPSLNREEFFAWLWEEYAQAGLVGIHEGTVLSDEAAEKGFETDSWTVDSAEAPAARDWVSSQENVNAELYFASREEAERAIVELEQEVPRLSFRGLKEQKDQDWDADWKASFLNAGNGVPVAPFWRIVPPWVQKNSIEAERWIKINPGAGFGTGTHETTQLCLRAIGEYSSKISILNEPALDFGSGSGILSIAMALLGARVDAVEVDTLAIQNSTENAGLNGVSDSIIFSQRLGEAVTYRYVVANILKPVLLEFAPQLVRSLQPGGVLILSGLIETDVPAVVDRYSNLLNTPVTQVYSLGEWRALVFAA
jgi:ribosomal protein L11 methyltransferase